MDAIVIDVTSTWHWQLTVLVVLFPQNSKNLLGTIVVLEYRGVMQAETVFAMFFFCFWRRQKNNVRSANSGLVYPVLLYHSSKRSLVFAPKISWSVSRVFTFRASVVLSAGSSVTNELLCRWRKKTTLQHQWRLELAMPTSTWRTRTRLRFLWGTAFAWLGMDLVPQVKAWSHFVLKCFELLNRVKPQFCHVWFQRGKYIENRRAIWLVTPSIVV